MNFPFFIAKRLSTGKHSGTSQLIVRIAVAGVALSVAVMIISFAIVKGYQYEISNKITGFSTHIQLSKLDLNNSFETIPIMTDTIMERMIKKEDGIKHIQRFAIKAGIIKTKDEFQGIVLKGVENGYNWQFIQQYLTQGEVLQFQDSVVSNSILISQNIADKMNLKIGDGVVMYFAQEPIRVRKFTVKGIYKTGFDEMDNLYAFVDIRQVQKLNNWFEGAISGYEIYIDDFSKLNQRAAQVVNYTPFNIEVRTTKEIHPELFDWLNLLDLNVIVIIVLMVVVACINMVTALLILIVERSNMIGILKALGAPNKTIGSTFIYMASYLILFGLLIGNIVGIGLCVSQQYWGWFKLSQEAYYLSEVPVRFSITDLLLINVAAFVICYLVLLLPARFVSRITPVKAIRFE